MALPGSGLPAGLGCLQARASYFCAVARDCCVAVAPGCRPAVGCRDAKFEP